MVARFSAWSRSKERGRPMATIQLYNVHSKCATASSVAFVLELEETLKLYINKLSPNVRRVRLTAAALGLKLEEIALDFTKGEHKKPEYLALNPNGAVPTLSDGDFVLTESRAIM